MPELHFARHRSQLKFTHYLFRFPAKFHPPVVRCLIERYSKRGDVILDPFCGSGTLLVEAVNAGRPAIGVDVDPVAAFVSRVKCTPIDPAALERKFARLLSELATIRRPSSEYDRLMHEDLSIATLNRHRVALHIPDIPKIEHWFKTYVALDLARLKRAIYECVEQPRLRSFFMACFAAVLRNASNADPVPVSGLEVTSHMRRLDLAGRRIDVFELFEKRVRREIRGMRELWEHASAATARVLCADATTLRRRLPPESSDVVITSPPYNMAVDYYRRHALEMYWLGFVNSHADRVALAPSYIGRRHVRQTSRCLKDSFDSVYVKRLIAYAARLGAADARDVTHYCASMQRALRQIAEVLKPGGYAVLVVGNSKWNGRRVRATRLLRELTSPDFIETETLAYETRNRYMSYSRRNGADVNREYAVVLRRKKK